MHNRCEKLMARTDEFSAIFIMGSANILYYSGFTSEDAYLILTHNDKYIITDSRYFVQAHEEAPDYTLIDIKEGWRAIFSGIREKRILFTEEAMTYGEYAILTANTDKEFIPFQSEIDRPRAVKDRREIELIRAAEEIGDMAFSYVLSKIHPGMREVEVAAELEAYMRKQGAEKTSFDTICASGVRSCMPHGRASEKVIEKGEFLTVDFGCVYQGYCSDMTRTICIGEPTEEMKRVYHTVLLSQMTVLENLQVGMECSEADRIARDVITTAGYGDAFTHALGHGVGIDIHEKPAFAPKSRSILSEGHVLSVEPGIYLNGRFGVRIEDLIAVCDGKIVNLTKSPKELIMI